MAHSLRETGKAPESLMRLGWEFHIFTGCRHGICNMMLISGVCPVNFSRGVMLPRELTAVRLRTQMTHSKMRNHSLAWAPDQSRTAFARPLITPHHRLKNCWLGLHALFCQSSMTRVRRTSFARLLTSHCALSLDRACIAPLCRTQSFVKIAPNGAVFTSKFAHWFGHCLGLICTCFVPLTHDCWLTCTVSVNHQ